MAKLTPAAKVGDTVHIKGTVTAVYETREGFISGYYFKSIHGTVNLIAPDEIVHIEPRLLAIGDIVFDNNKTPSRYEIIGINGDEAWTKSQSTGKTYVEKLSDLTRIDDNE